ncbi:sensor histidine kinase [Clostridiaceae bacterium 35-E11]
MRFVKIRTKIIATLILMTMLTATLISFTSYYISLKVIYEQAGKLGLESAKYNAERIEAWAKEKAASLKRTAVHLEKIDGADKQKIQKMLQDAAEADRSFFSTFVGLENGDLIDGKGWIPGEKYETTQRPWYQEAKKKNQVAFTPVYMDKNKKKQVNAIAIPIYIDGQEGVLAANMHIDKVHDQMNRIRFGKTGYGILLDQNGVMITHPDEDYMMKSIEEIFRNENIASIHTPKEKNMGVEIVAFNQIKHLLVYVPIEFCDWELLLLAPLSEFQDPAKKMLLYFIVITGACLLVMIIVGFFIGKSMSKPIEKMIKSVSKLATGDLTENIDIATKDEIGILSVGLNTMRKNLIHMIQDIQNESDLLYKNAQRLTRSIEEISGGMIDFISLLSHDIKTPLTLIKGYIKGIQLGIANEPEKMEQYLNGIYERAEQIENITEDILDSAYEVEKSLILKKEMIDLQEFIFSLYQQAKMQIESSDRIFKGALNIAQGQCYIDAVKWNRVWNNLINNAIKYSDKHSTITITVRQEKDFVIFSIKDEGIGMKEEDLEKIFDMFYRAKENRVKGYGIGLYISKKIIEAHGGVIKVASKLGEGSNFMFTVPVCH